VTPSGTESTTNQKRKMIAQLVSGELETEDFVQQLLKLGAEQILQETMEQERTAFLRRDWYARQATEQEMSLHTYSDTPR